MSNEKAQFVTREHEIKYDIKSTSSFSEPAFLLTMFHPMFPGEHGVEHYSCQPRETTPQHARLQQNGGKISCCLSRNGGDGGEHRARKRRRNPTNIR